MPGTWPTSAISRSSRPSICPSIDPSSTPSFTSSRPSPPTRSTRSSPSSIFSPAISSKQQPEKPLIRVKIGAAHLLVIEKGRHRVFIADVALLDDIGAVTDQRREMEVLFRQDDRLTLRLQADDGMGHHLGDPGRQAF